MANTFVKISSVTVGAGGASSIAFNSIPQTYTDLVVKLSTRITNAVDLYGVVVSINGASSSSGFNWRRLQGDGSSATSQSGTNGFAGHVEGTSYTSNTFGNCELYFPNYTGSTNKSFLIDDVTENNATAAYAILVANIWNTTSAITSFSFASVGTYAQYSTATLYGIKK
jgi:hypothetical protein